MVLFFYIVLDHSPILRNLLGAPTNNVMNIFIWPCYIIAPLVYMNLYCTLNEAIYMTMLNNIYLGMGAMWTTIFVALAFQYLILNPVEGMCDLTIRRLVESTRPNWKGFEDMKRPLVSN